MISKLDLPKGHAICYSGYRHGQSPCDQIYPSFDEIRQDLLIMQPYWRLLRLYDCSTHAERVLEVIRRDGLDFQIMLGAHLGAEMNNFGCPWGATYSEEQLEASVAENDAEIGRSEP
jgi:exo-beta-1,3-glucanase (GH17 family)